MKATDKSAQLVVDFDMGCVENTVEDGTPQATLSFFVVAILSPIFRLISWAGGDFAVQCLRQEPRMP